MTCVHASRGIHAPAGPRLLSEPQILSGIARAALPFNAQVPWEAWAGNYALVRDEIAAIYPQDFHRFNARLDLPGGFPRHVAARSRIWETESKRANFLSPSALDASFAAEAVGDVLRLITLRSNDQFNTTVYGMDDRLRGIHGSREIVMIRASDRARLGFSEGARVTLRTAHDDGTLREVPGLQLIDYDLPEGTLAAYYPECNPLIPLSHYARESKTPAAKSVPVRIFLTQSGA